MAEIDYKKLYEEEKVKNGKMQETVDSFSLPSKAKLFYALNRHQNNWADMLNKIELADLNIDDPKDKTVERLKMIYGLIGANTPIVDALRTASGVTGDEDKDMTARKPFIDGLAMKRE